MIPYKPVAQSNFEVEDSSKHEPSRWRSWRVTIVAGALIATAVLLTNGLLLAWTSTEGFEIEDGIATIFEGDCVASKRMSTISHLAINIFGTLLFSASNNCAQLLSSPTIKDIAVMHKEGKWMDIGVSSLRNLRYIPTWRAALWAVLMLSSMPLHLLYNSVIFTTTSGHDYRSMLVTEDFVTGGWWNQTRFDLLQVDYPANISGDIKAAQKHAVAGQLIHMDIKRCNEIYNSPHSVDFPYGNLLVVTSAKLTDNVIDFADWSGETSFTSDQFLAEMNEANQCQVDPNHYSYRCPLGTGLSCSIGKVDCESVTTPLAYCLAEPFLPKCTVKLARTLLVIVAACNAAKIAAMLICVFWMFRPLATTGDAVAAFLDNADPQAGTQGPLSVVDVRRPDSIKPNTAHGRRYREKLLRWRSAAHIGGFFSRWILGLFTAISLLICGIVLLVIAVRGMGIGPYFRGYSGSVEMTKSTSTLFNVVLPNVPQILVSFVSVFYNNAITYMLLAYEWSKFASDRKPLRVTSPTGQQRSTFWLQLPYRYALPLMATMALLHWLISQSIFLVQKNVYDEFGKLMPQHSTNECQYSSFAILLAVIVGALLTLALIAISFRKLKPGIPMVGSCSIAISAACGNAMEVDAATKPLKYGVLSKAPDKDGINYVGFSQYDVAPLVDGVAYL